MSDLDPGDPTQGRARRLVVDRFEGDLAVVEVDGDRVLDVPRWLLPHAAREGDTIVVRVTPASAEEHSLTLTVDEGATAAAKQEVQSILSRLRQRDPGGDIDL